MITNALEIGLFLAIIAWPITLPMVLALLAGLILFIVYCVQNRKNKKIQIAAGVLTVCVLLLALLLVSTLKRESQSYSEGAALRLYESHQTAYDTVAVFMLERAEADGGQSLIISYSLSSREKWPEEIKRDLNEALNNWSLRCGNPDVSVSTPRSPSKDLPVLFKIYSGPEYDTGDGAMGFDIQYLAYVPNVADSRLQTRRLTHLTGDWYLYTGTSW